MDRSHLDRRRFRLEELESRLVMSASAGNNPGVLPPQSHPFGATYGEWWMGAGRGTQTLVGLTLGTGIGGGIVLNG